jgi:hypothetical protein
MAAVFVKDLSIGERKHALQRTPTRANCVRALLSFTLARLNDCRSDDINSIKENIDEVHD